MNQPMEHYQVADLFGRRLRPDLEIECGIGKITRNGYQCNLRFHIVNLGKAIAKHPALIIEPRSCKLRYDEPSGDFEYKEYEIDHGQRKGTFKKYLGVIYPDVKERVGDIQSRIDDNAGYLDLKIEVVAEDMPIKEYFILIAIGPLSGLKETYHPDSDNFYEFELMNRVEYEKVVNRLTRGHGFQK